MGPLVRRNLPPGRPLFPSTVELGDIVKGLPVQRGHCRAIYCSHVLEHLALEDCRIALRHTYEYLEPGGIFRLVMPDLRSLASAYLDCSGRDAAHRFMERAHLGKRTRSTSLPARVATVFGNADHLWMWDYPSMSEALERQGFVEVRRAAFGDSTEPRFADVEDRSRWEEPGFEGEGVIPCLGVECRKPGA